jgi:hypothetical protein
LTHPDFAALATLSSASGKEGWYNLKNIKSKHLAFTLFPPQAEERVDQRSEVGVSKATDYPHIAMGLKPIAMFLLSTITYTFSSLKS